MAIYTLCSAGGSPGVSSTALGLAMTWPRPVILVEADPSGSKALLGGYFRGQVPSDALTKARLRGIDTSAMTMVPGLGELAYAARQGELAERLPQLLVDVPETNAKLLFGSENHLQSVSLTLLWDDLLLELQALGPKTGQDVIVDAGRLGLDGSPTPFLRRSDVTLLVTRSTLRDLAAAMSWSHAMLDANDGGRYVGGVVVGPGRPCSIREASQALSVVNRQRRIEKQMDILGGVAWAPRHAASLSHGEPFPKSRWKFWQRDAATQRQFNASGYMKSIRALGESARKQAQHVEEELGLPSMRDLDVKEVTR